MDIRPPTVTPSEIKVKIPCKGTPEEAFIITIKNPSSEKIAFQVKTTKPKFFKIEPAVAFVEPQTDGTVSVQPVENYSSDMWTKMDRFTVNCAPAPKKGNLWTAEDVWTPGKEVAATPKEIKKFTIPLRSDTWIPQPPRGTKMDLKINVTKLTLVFPSRPDMAERVTMTNPTAYRIAFRVKPSKNAKRCFTISDEYGIIDAGKTAHTTIAAVAMTRKGKLADDDHIAILSTVAPGADDWTTTSQMIFEKKLAEERHIREHKIAIETRGGD